LSSFDPTPRVGHRERFRRLRSVKILVIGSGGREHALALALSRDPGVDELHVAPGNPGMEAIAELHEVDALDGIAVAALALALDIDLVVIGPEAPLVEGVADKVRFELIDYRDVTGRFDRIVSVGMFEHVGPPQYRTFFRKCRDLLTDDGVMLLHTIGRMGRPGTTDAFMQKYIFPGGYIPALSETLVASEHERLIMTDCETLRFHYYHTIRHWYDRTAAQRDEIVRRFDERLHRLWLFYLAAAMTMFTESNMVNYQIQYARRRDALPMTRNYMLSDETRLQTILT